MKQKGSKQQSQGHIKFVRIRGRIVPIRNNKKVGFGDVIKSKGVSAKSAARKMGYKGKVITSVDELNADKDLGFFRKFQLRGAMKMAEKGENAFADRYKGKNYLFTGKKVNKVVLAHEIGHTRDFDKVGLPKWHQMGATGMLTGGIMKVEKKAWALAPHKRTKELKNIEEMALKTYSDGVRNTRIAFGAVVALNVANYGIKKWAERQGGF